MPEGDVVWLTAQRLHRALIGRPLVTSEFRVPQLAALDLSGQRVAETVSRGKHLLSRLDEVTIHTHLAMEGSWHIYRPGSRWRSPAFQARLVLATDEWQVVGFRLAVVEVVERSAEDTVVGHLGPDLLGPDWSLGEALARLSAASDEPIAEALLDQRNLAGIGNLYKSEACFLLGVHPATAVGQVDVLPQLIDKARRLLIANRDRAEQVTTGIDRHGLRLWVYLRGGKPCRRCGTPIQSTEQGREGAERVTFWCPTCQPSHIR